MDEWQYFDEWDEDENSIIRNGHRFTVNWASKGMWLMPMTRTGGFFELILFGLLAAIDRMLAHHLPVKVGIICQRVQGWKPSWPRVIYKEWIPGIGDFEFVEQRMEELLALAKDGYFDHLKPGKS